MNDGAMACDDSNASSASAGADLEEVKMSEELSAAFYAAASAVSRFNKQCAMEEQRHCAAGFTRMMVTVAEHVKAESVGGLVAVSAILSFLRRQLLHLPACDEPGFACADSKPPATGERDDVQTGRFQTAAAALAAMQIHTRQAQRKNVVSGARQAAQLVARNLLPLEGQNVQEAVLLGFFERHITQRKEPSVEATEATGEMRRPSMPAPVVQQTVRQQTSAPMQQRDVGSPANSSKKRSHDSMTGVHLDPAFEQAFKRQCQMPPTPPRFRRQ